MKASRTWKLKRGDGVETSRQVVCKLHWWRFWLVRVVDHKNPRSCLAIALEYDPCVFSVVLQGYKAAWAFTFELHG